MKRFVIAAVAIAALLMSSSLSRAQDGAGYPDLRGQWKGTNQAIVIGSGTHHRTDDKPGEPRLRNVEFTLDVIGQTDRRFWGKTISGDDSSTTIGVIESDRQTVHLLSAEGELTARLVAPGKLDGCYTRSLKDHMIAACAVFTKQ